MKRNTTVSFSGHETFSFRYGWLKKGVDAVSNDSMFFSNDRAMVELGVGKNMVRSIKHWCIAAGLITESERGRFIPTKIGQDIFGDGGYDPYLEDLATLWFIHWQIASNPRTATTWFWVFGYWSALEFTKDRLASEVRSRLDNYGYEPVSDNTLKRDVDCFIRTYVRSQQTRELVFEDTLDCPLVDLRLVTQLADGKTYQFQRGAQVSLPDAVLAFALIEYWRSCLPSTQTVAFDRVAYAPGSPGRVFKLDEDSLTSRLEHIESVTSGALVVDETGGLKQVYKRSDKDIDSFELLRSYYRNQQVSVHAAKR